MALKIFAFSVPRASALFVLFSRMLAGTYREERREGGRVRGDKGEIPATVGARNRRKERK